MKHLVFVLVSFFSISVFGEKLEAAKEYGIILDQWDKGMPAIRPELVGVFQGTCYWSAEAIQSLKERNEKVVNPNGVWLVGRAEGMGLRVGMVFSDGKDLDFYNLENYKKFENRILDVIRDEPLAAYQNGSWVVPLKNGTAVQEFRVAEDGTSLVSIVRNRNPSSRVPVGKPQAACFWFKKLH